MTLTHHQQHSHQRMTNKWWPVAIYGLTASKYGTAVYGSSGSPLVRQTVEGSGFTVAVRVDDTSGLLPFSLKAYQLEFTPPRKKVENGRIFSKTVNVCGWRRY